MSGSRRLFAAVYAPCFALTNLGRRFGLASRGADFAPGVLTVALGGFALSYPTPSDTERSEDREG